MGFVLFINVICLKLCKPIWSQVRKHYKANIKENSLIDYNTKILKNEFQPQTYSPKCNSFKWILSMLTIKINNNYISLLYIQHKILIYIAFNKKEDINISYTKFC
ncbi:MAG: hypothetical protein Ta2E_00610 [Mycoplasmoidaceae bacterium]|nr:MAG: hypothetical protein Ta2E_00610 [Mycoplasmoidaceae bacterium]